MKLRYYQSDAINAVVEHIETKTTNPCVVVPTGGGKTPIIANLCKLFVESGYRVLVCAHRKELLEQTAEKLRVWAPNVGVGVVSAGLGRQEYGADVTVAGIQSVYRRVNELTAAGKIDFLLVDEAHLIPAQDEKEGGMYRTLIDDLKRVEPALATIGLTATPYRLTSGDVCGPKNILNEICYEVGVAELIGGGFLSNLVSKEPPQNVDFDALKIERGEFKTADVEEKCGSDQEIANAVRNLVAYTKNRASVLVFCFSVAHAQKVAAELERRTGVKNVAVVVGETDKNERRAILERFQGKRSQTTLFGDELPPLKYLVNV
ncbi:MAG: DEAD/DEAH box helicase family protein, partial [Thermoguttaceae bacterium]|nr:DEAD/DEAH box helicase family protein [Thermoguttaceae bacterium]